MVRVRANAGYQPIAHTASLLYFAVVELAALNPMYSFGLPWFTSLFSRSISASTPAPELSLRLAHLAEHFTYFLFADVCRSLFERHKLLFAFNIAIKLGLDQGTVMAAELRFLLTGGVALGSESAPSACSDWLSDKAWGELCRASSSLGAAWDGLASHIQGMACFACS